MQYNLSLSGWEGGSAPPVPRTFTLVQHNCRPSLDVFLSLFSSFSQLTHTPSVVALQYPPVYSRKLPSFQFNPGFSPPGTGDKKRHVPFYICSSFLSTITLLPPFFERGDIMALDHFPADGVFNTGMTWFTIIDSYSTKGRSNNT